ncbi:MAG: hypothetical protein WBF77_13595 [Sulfurimonadaceae bacterium]
MGLTKSLLVLTVLLLFSACSQLTLEEKNSQQKAIDDMADYTIEALSKEDAAIMPELEQAKGYMVVNWKVTKVPVVGAGGGNGVVVDQRSGKRVYITVKRFDIGGGWGARSYKNLVIINDDALMDEAKDGVIKFEAGAEVAAGTKGVDGGSGALNPKIQTHMLLDGGGSATATVRVLRSSLNSDLN